MAFTFATPTLARHPRRNLRLASRRPREILRARQPTRCSYATDLQTRTSSVTTDSTDNLLNRVQTQLNTNVTPSFEVLQEMVLHLADSRGMARLNLVNAFGKIGDIAVPYLLEGLATCPNPVVRRSCGKALAQIGDPRGTKPLIHALQTDSDTVARASAAGALAKIGRSAIPAILDLLADPTASMSAKGHSAWALAYMQSDATDALLEAARHPADDVRLAVVSALGTVLLGDALPVMNDNSALDDDDEERDSKVLTAVEKALHDALGDACAAVRAEAVNALASGARGRYVTDVAGLLNDESAETRRAAALGLMKMGDTSVIGAIRERVEDDSEEEQVRSVARLALRALERLEEEEEWDE